MSSLDYHSDSENDWDTFTHSWVKKFYFDQHSNGKNTDTTELLE